MAFVRPISKTIISSTEFGQEVYDRIMAAPRGRIGSATLSNPQSNIGPAYVDIPGLSVTFTAVAQRWYKATVHLTTMSNASSACLFICRITDAAGNSLAGAQYGVWAGGQIGLTCTMAPRTLTAGTQTLKARIYCSANSGLISNAADQPSCIIVEDLGAV